MFCIDPAQAAIMQQAPIQMKTNWLIIIITGLVVIMLISGLISASKQNEQMARLKHSVQAASEDTVWHGAAASQIPYYSQKNGAFIYYGYQLINNTSYYLGPKGKIAHLTNGLNCQTCPLGAGTLPYCNNFRKVYAT